MASVVSNTSGATLVIRSKPHSSTLKGSETSPPKSLTPADLQRADVAPLSKDTTICTHDTPNLHGSAHRTRVQCVEGKQVKHVKANEVLDLVGRLSLGTWLCGGLTLKKQPCKKKITKVTQNRIVVHIGSMIDLQESPDELARKIEELVVLAHCKFHDHGEAKDVRIRVWSSIFGIGKEASVSAVKTVAEQIRDVLGSVSITCIAAVGVSVTCGRRIGGQKVLNCMKSIAEIIEPRVYSRPDKLDKLLRVLEWNMCCDIHDVGTLSRTLQWTSTIWKVASLEITKPLAQGLLQSSDLDFSRDPAEFWPKAYDNSPFNIIGKWNKHDPRAVPDPACDRLRRVLEAPLTEHHVGYVYLYEVAGNKGFVKLGYTGVSVEERQTQWSFDCNRKAVLLYPDSGILRVPNPHRIEDLCHAELQHCRVRIFCSACLKQHIEWFETSPEEAIRVIQKWSSWMKTNPYQERSLRDGAKWVLKEKEATRIRNDIQRFLDETAHSNISS